MHTAQSLKHIRDETTEKCLKCKHLLPWLTINLNFCIVARLPLTRYIPSTSRPETQKAYFYSLR